MSKTFILAPDSFKESMTAQQACLAMERGIHRVIPNATCVHMPMADGGEGTLDALLLALNGEKIACETMGPLPSQLIQSYIGWIESSRTVIIEMAKTNGIDLLTPQLRNPLLTTTFGTGQMILKALDLNPFKIIIGLGGSVTNDAGAGMAQALGIRILDHHGHDLSLGGGQLGQISSIDVSQLDTRLAQTQLVIASDVTNPLCGEQGASVVFGPQKGATPDMVEHLDAQLDHFSNIVEMQLGVHVKHQAGAGAAGGLGFGLMAFTGANIQSGADLIIQELGLAEKIAHSDYVFTGEGRIDAQTRFGKTPWAVAQLAKRYDKAVIAFAGSVGPDVEQLLDAGFHQIIGINPPDTDIQWAIQHAETQLEHACMRYVRDMLHMGKHCMI